MDKSIYDFATLEDALVYYERLGFLATEVRIGGTFGGPVPTEDDDPVFITED
jgi:hypothetical protein